MKSRASKAGAGSLRRSPCPIANTLDLVGDKWSLLIIRDMLCGRSTFGELANSPEGVPTNILADRLRRLEDAGVIGSSAYQDNPVRYAYSLSDKGKELAEVVQAFVQWGKKHIPGTMTYEDAGYDFSRARSARNPARQRRKGSSGD
jgi:DNA-binding HxlR family transcriptional regulator